jgi:predicted Zn finger-like uncharacterized protein
MSLATRCPICEALFRVTPNQLRVRGGQVRCGRCSAVFDGLAHLVPEADRSASATDEATSESSDTPRSEIETLDFASGPPRVPSMEPATPVPAGSSTAVEPVTGTGAVPRPGADWLRREWKTVAVSALLVALLAAQLGLQQRDMLAAKHPGLRGTLVALCAVVGCEVTLPRAVDLLSIEGDELIAANPNDPSRILLVATLRNGAAFPVAYPSLELTLQNARDEILARRVLGPADYLAAGSDLTHGLAAHGDLSLRLALDTGPLRAEGYRLFLFYP